MPRVLDSLLDWIYPPRCPACDADVCGRVALCGTCEISLYPLGARCPRCAEPVEGPRNVTCHRCRRRAPPFESIDAPFRYGGELAVALRRFKFDRRIDIGRTLAPLLTPALARSAADADVVIPLPLHWRRLAHRGFNQATVLTDEAAFDLRTPIDRVALRRVRHTAPQTGLTAAERTRNVAGAFSVPRRHRARVAHRRVLLVDDVVTTGATMAAAARALRRAGARSIRGLCLARADT